MSAPYARSSPASDESAHHAGTYYAFQATRSAWHVYFHNGCVTWDTKDMIPRHVRAVRGGLQ